MATLASSFQNIARAVSAYSDEAYTDARRISSTELMGTDARINVNAEDYYGTIRWDKTLGDLNYSRTAGSNMTEINYGDESANDGKVTNMQTDVAEYIKSIRNVGADQYNVTQVITQRDGAIAKLGRDFGVVRARDTEDAVRAVLTGVIDSEAGVGSGAAATRFGQELSNPLNSAAGFYFDVNGPHAVGVSQSDNAASRSNTLVDTSSAGGKAAKHLFEAMGAGFGDLEPDFMYAFIDQETLYDLRIANLLDEQDRVTDGSITFDTILSGKIRLFVSRTGLGDFSPSSAAATDNVNAGSSKTTLLALPGVIANVDLAQPNPVELDSDASTGRGTGNREIWYRWGYVMHPRGYTWAGAKDAFAKNTREGTEFDADECYDQASNWTRKDAPGNLGMLPIFHS